MSKCFIKFEECHINGYAARTEYNASADATLAFATNFNTAGERCTKLAVLNQGKRYIPIHLNTLTISESLINEIVGALNKCKAKTLNIAGNGIYTIKNYTQERLDTYVYDILYTVINSLYLENKIESIRTGGQTGIDEAGAKAGARLNIPTLVLAPKKWKFRTVDGIDIADEKRFKERFNINS